MRRLGEEATRHTRRSARPPASTTVVLVQFLVIALAIVAGWRIAPRPILGDRWGIVEWTTAGMAAPLVVAVAACVGVARWKAGCWTHGRGVVTVLLAVLGWFLGACGLMMLAWNLGESVTGPDGRVYRECSQWWTIGLARRTEASWDGVTWEVVAIGGSDHPREYAILFRPRDRIVARLEATPDDVIVEAGGPTCYLAYDVGAQAGLSGDELSALSPFALLREGEDGSEEDVQTLEAALVDLRENDPAYVEVVVPDQRVLLDELDSENPWVREAAARLVITGGPDRYPRAHGLVTKDE